MKIILIVLLALNLYAFDIKLASKIFNKLFIAIVQKDNIYVFTKEEEYFEVIKLAEHLNLANKPQNADIILVNKEINLPKNLNKILFTTEYKLFKKNQHAIGVFYWKHGRPKIIFTKERLKYFNITLDSKWNKYIKSENQL